MDAGRSVNNGQLLEVKQIIERRKEEKK